MAKLLPRHLRLRLSENCGDLFLVIAECVLTDRLGVVLSLCLGTGKSDNEVVANRLYILGRRRLSPVRNTELILNRVTRIVAVRISTNLTNLACIYVDPNVYNVAAEHGCCDGVPGLVNDGGDDHFF